MFLLTKTSKINCYKQSSSLTFLEFVWPQNHAGIILFHFPSISVLTLNIQNCSNHKISKYEEVSAVNWGWLSKLCAFWSKDLRAFCSLHSHRGVSKKIWSSHVHKIIMSNFYFFLMYKAFIFVWFLFPRKSQRFMREKIQKALTLKEHKHICKLYIHIIYFSYKKLKDFINWRKL